MGVIDVEISKVDACCAPVREPGMAAPRPEADCAVLLRNGRSYVAELAGATLGATNVERCTVPGFVEWIQQQTPPAVLGRNPTAPREGEPASLLPFALSLAYFALVYALGNICTLCGPAELEHYLPGLIAILIWMIADPVSLAEVRLDSHGASLTRIQRSGVWSRYKPRVDTYPWKEVRAIDVYADEGDHVVAVRLGNLAHRDSFYRSFSRQEDADEWAEVLRSVQRAYHRPG